MLKALCTRSSSSRSVIWASTAAPFTIASENLFRIEGEYTYGALGVLEDEERCGCGRELLENLGSSARVGRLLSGYRLFMEFRTNELLSI